MYGENHAILLAGERAAKAAGRSSSRCGPGSLAAGGTALSARLSRGQSWALAKGNAAVRGRPQGADITSPAGHVEANLLQIIGVSNLMQRGSNVDTCQLGHVRAVIE